MTDSLFSENDILVDPNKNYLEELVGDGKKFKDPESLAKGKFHADQTLELYKKRMDDMREENLNLRQETNAKARLEDLIDQYQQKLASNNQTPVKEDNQKPPVDIEEVFSKKLQEHEAKKKAEENFSTVQKKLKEQFGENSSSILKQRSDELGLSIEDINALARKAPKAFFNTLGLEQSNQRDSFNSPPSSQQRADQFAPKVQKRTWSYYQEQMKKDHNLLYDRQFAVQMQKDAIDLGEDFRDGDYYKPGLHDK